MKRMIDNKEYNEFKKGVNDLNEKVNNIKGVPTITIDVSQMLSADEAQLTDEQLEILTNNAFVNVVMPTGEKIGFNIMQNETTLILSNCLGSSSEITYYRGSVIKSSKIVTLSIGDFSGGGKQLYQHNIRMHTSNLSITITITNTDNTAFTKSSINTWLSDKGFTGASPNYDTYNLGFVYSSSNDKLVSQGIAFRSGTTFSYKNIVGSWVGINDSDITFDLDTVITI